MEFNHSTDHDTRTAGPCPAAHLSSPGLPGSTQGGGRGIRASEVGAKSHIHCAGLERVAGQQANQLPKYLDSAPPRSVPLRAQVHAVAVGVRLLGTVTP
jgi:hypothetical protein